MSRVLVAMSGGVDSSAAALIMKKKGWEVEGVTMSLFGETSDEAADARGVAEKLGFPFRVLDLRDEFKREVVDPFTAAYIEGRTPNPCILCNKSMKFGRLMQEAEKLGCDAIATGHYARIDTDGGSPVLKKAADPSKDQSYVLYTLERDLLSRICFPLGDIVSKDETRKIAAEAGLANSKKKESQDICFIPDGDYASFIEKTGYVPECGEFVDEDGRVLGEHRGMIRYTTGQRKGLGISALPEPYYVIAKDPAENRIVLGPNDRLFRRELSAAGANWLLYSRENVPEEIRCAAKIRYRAKEAPCTVYIRKGDPSRFDLVFDEPQRAITPGQSVVLYDGDVVIGGGTIE